MAAAHSCLLGSGASTTVDPCPRTRRGSRVTVSSTAWATVDLAPVTTRWRAASGDDDRHRVRVVLEARSGRDTSFETMMSTPLRCQLARGPLDGVAGLGGEAHQHLALAPTPAELGEDVRGRLQDQVRHTVLLAAASASAASFGRKSATAAAITTTSDAAERASTACSISAAVSTLTTS